MKHSIPHAPSAAQTINGLAISDGDSEGARTFRYVALKPHCWFREGMAWTAFAGFKGLNSVCHERYHNFSNTRIKRRVKIKIAGTLDGGGIGSIWRPRWTLGAKRDVRMFGHSLDNVRERSSLRQQRGASLSTGAQVCR
jgi:hypothetical protein